MNLLLFNLAVDENHVTLSFGLRWIEALALRFEHIDVVTMTCGARHLPTNVRVWSLGQELGYPRWLRAIRFYWLVGRIMSERHIDIVFTHMIPVLAVLYWPVAKLTAKKNVLWYAHGATPKMVKFAHALVDRVVTSTPEGFRLPSRKVSCIGQGIDAELYAPRIRSGGMKFRILSVSRFASSKGLDILISALSGWCLESSWQLILVGDATSETERVYADKLRHQAIEALGPERVVFTGRLQAKAIADQMAAADVFVNLGSTGSLDKAIVEAMASGCLVLSSNDAFRSLAQVAGFPECAIERSPQALASALTRVYRMGVSERRTLSGRLVSVARTDHSLDGFIGRLHSILEETALSAGR